MHDVRFYLPCSSTEAIGRDNLHPSQMLPAACCAARAGCECEMCIMCVRVSRLTYSRGGNDIMHITILLHGDARDAAHGGYSGCAWRIDLSTWRQTGPFTARVYRVCTATPPAVLSAVGTDSTDAKRCRNRHSDACAPPRH